MSELSGFGVPVCYSVDQCKVYKPHKDRNSLERESAFSGITKFHRGRLRIEGLPGEQNNDVLQEVDDS